MIEIRAKLSQQSYQTLHLDNQRPMLVRTDGHACRTTIREERRDNVRNRQGEADRSRPAGEIRQADRNQAEDLRVLLNVIFLAAVPPHTSSHTGRRMIHLRRQALRHVPENRSCTCPVSLLALLHTLLFTRCNEGSDVCKLFRLPTSRPQV